MTNAEWLTDKLTTYLWDYIYIYSVVQVQILYELRHRSTTFGLTTLHSQMSVYRNTKLPLLLTGQSKSQKWFFGTKHNGQNNEWNKLWELFFLNIIRTYLKLLWYRTSPVQLKSVFPFTFTEMAPQYQNKRKNKIK